MGRSSRHEKERAAYGERKGNRQPVRFRYQPESTSLSSGIGKAMTPRGADVAARIVSFN